jgi:hypothetical protein
MPYFGIPIRNGLPIGLGSVAGFGVQQFSPADLFSAGEQGAWYDPSDFSTLFTDSAGTTPVTGVEQFVGLMLDKSKGLVPFWSNYFSGSGQYVSTPSNSGFAFGTGDFTVEAWVWSNDVSGSERGFFQTSDAVGGIKTSYASGLAIGFGAAGVLRAYAGASVVSATSGSMPQFAWTHVAVTRASGTLTIWINGVSRGTGAAADNLTGTNCAFGGYYSNSFLFNGYLSNLRVVKGTALYTGTFTPPQPNLPAVSGTTLLTCQSSTFVDNSTNALALTLTGSPITTQRIPFGNHATQTTSAKRPKLAARYNLLLGTDTLATQSVTTAATTYTLRFGGTGSIALTGTATGTYSAGTHSITATAGTLTLTVTGSVTTADLRPASQAAGLIGPTYQRVVDAATYDAVGFLPYLQFDGIDDSMSTGSIDFSAGDKVTLWAGVRKLSDANTGTVAQLSPSTSTNNGVFGLYVPFNTGASADNAWISKGTTRITVNSPVNIGPATSVFTGVGNISAPLAQLRQNAIQVATSSASQGTGNFGNFALNIGEGAGFLNGWLSSLIVRGAQSTQSQIEATESWVNGKTGAY